METMRPRRRSIMPSSTARVQLMNPHMSTAISRSHSSRGFSMNSRSTVQPAQLTRTSTPPRRCWASAAMAWTDSQEVTSVDTNSAPPASAAVRAPRSPSRSAISTRAPSAAKPRTTARPMLEAPPVTTTPRPARPRSIGGHSGDKRKGEPSPPLPSVDNCQVVFPVPCLPTTYLEANAAAAPERPAIIEGDLELTFSGLRERVHAVAAALQERGVGEGDVVALTLPNVWQYVALELAIPLLGAIVLPLPPSLGQAEGARGRAPPPPPPGRRVRGRGAALRGAL